MKQFRPKQQGDLDSLCGVHAIINALYAHDPTMTHDDLMRLFKAILRAAEKHAERPVQLLWDGLDQQLLQRMLRRAVRRVRSKTLAFKHKRLKQAKGQTLDQALHRLQKKLDAGWLAIASMSGAEEHWTVIRRITAQRIYLIDSSQKTFLKIRDCALQPKKSKYVLFADDVLLVRRRDV
jgi:hypothetical protein